MECKSQGECGEGTCEFGIQVNITYKVNLCKCDEGYLDHDGKPCSYAQKDKLTAFLLSFLIGGLGADWFYLAQGQSCSRINRIFCPKNWPQFTPVKLPETPFKEDTYLNNWSRTKNWFS